MARAAAGGAGGGDAGTLVTYDGGGSWVCGGLCSAGNERNMATCSTRWWDDRSRHGVGTAPVSRPLQRNPSQCRRAAVSAVVVLTSCSALPVACPTYRRGAGVEVESASVLSLGEVSPMFSNSMFCVLSSPQAQTVERSCCTAQTVP